MNNNIMKRMSFN